jgi:hypothetical protein
MKKTLSAIQTVLVLFLLFNCFMDGGGNEWSRIQTIDSSGSVGLFTSTAMDGSNVCISYYDETNGDLKCAKSKNRGKTW